MQALPSSWILPRPLLLRGMVVALLEPRGKSGDAGLLRLM